MSDWNLNDPLERIPGESKRANAALSDYALMGSVRGLRGLLKIYRERTGAPTTSWKTLSAWSADFAWVERSTRFDELQREKDQAAYEARRRQIMESGFALDFERVAELKALYEKYREYLADENNIWLPDVKSIRVGSSLEVTQDGKSREVGEYERVEYFRFNEALLNQLRGLLEDLAKETGGRVHKTDLTSKDEKIVVKLVSDGS